MSDDLQPNAARFAAAAALYDAVRPTPPDAVADLLIAYAGGGRPRFVVDLGSGSGLSTRWAAAWADAVAGVEPGDEMRAVAEQQPLANVTYRPGWAHASGLAAHAADVVLAVQALHWMEPGSTFREIGRLLRPGGVFAAIDCDWPPTSGNVAADEAWATARKKVRLYEKRLALGATGAALAAPVDLVDPELRDHSARDTHSNRMVANGVRSWSKDDHLRRMQDSGVFAWCHEVALHRIDHSSPSRFVDLLRSQGDYQTLRAAGLDDDVLGATDVERVAVREWNGGTRPLLFTFRVRIGVTA